MTFLVVATRIHLDKATAPPSNLPELIQNFNNVCRECQRSTTGHASDSTNRADTDRNNNDNDTTVVVGVIAVDSTERIAGFNLVEAVQMAVAKVTNTNDGPDTSTVILTVLPVQPWGKFVPALNALVSWAAAQSTTATPISSVSTDTTTTASHHQNTKNNNTSHPPLILFCSAETNVSAQAVTFLRSHMDNDTLVCGAVLPGHDYQGEELTVSKTVTTALNGRTTPWNTLALWNLSKLALTGFQSVSDGLHNPSTAGVEEVVAIAVLQRIFGPEHACAKLIRMPQHNSDDTDDSLQWNPTFSDPSRQAWHEQKMQSKLERAQYQMDLMRLEGIVHHC